MILILAGLGSILVVGLWLTYKYHIKVRPGAFAMSNIQGYLVGVLFIIIGLEMIYNQISSLSQV